MTDLPAADPRRSLRLAIYSLLIVLSAGSMVGRILAVRSDLGETPLLGANDRSRWCTIRALVDHGTYAIDDVIFYRNGKRDREWYTIDMVWHRDRAGKHRYYSSKPPLLPTLLAGEYWVVKKVTGAGLAGLTSYVARIMLILTNVLPLVIYFVLLSSIVERYAKQDWTRLFVMSAATFGTFLTTFAVTLNNHLPAAISVLIAVHATMAVWCEGKRNLHYFTAAGTFAAFAAANELPALSFLAAIGAALFFKAPKQTLLRFVPAAGVVAAAFFWTNHQAHDSWRPPYAHRHDGAVVATVDASLTGDRVQPVPDAVRAELAKEQIDLSSKAAVRVRENGGWELWDPAGEDRLALATAGERVEVREWDQWYEYDRSYWKTGRKMGVDRGESSRGLYAFHTTIGHHGIFSLTPIWLLSAIGAVLLIRDRDHKLRAFGWMVILLTGVCLAFYLSRPIHDRNYGGMTCGLRWMFWFTPLWLICLMPMVDRLACCRTGRAACSVLLLLSVASAWYRPLNPWLHPWFYDYLQYVGAG